MLLSPRVPIGLVAGPFALIGGPNTFPRWPLVHVPCLPVAGTGPSATSTISSRPARPSSGRRELPRAARATTHTSLVASAAADTLE
jgi:hypothetical protein